MEIEEDTLQRLDRELEGLPAKIEEAREAARMYGEVQTISRQIMNQYDSLTVDKFTENGNEFDEESQDNGLYYVDKILADHADVRLYGVVLDQIVHTMDNRFKHFRAQPHIKSHLLVSKKFREDIDNKQHGMTNAAITMGLLKFKQQIMAEYGTKPKARKATNGKTIRSTDR